MDSAVQAGLTISWLMAAMAYSMAYILARNKPQPLVPVIFSALTATIYLMSMVLSLYLLSPGWLTALCLLCLSAYAGIRRVGLSTLRWIGQLGRR
jgi:hypothetical protein